jgi:hypothetical protein
VTGPKNLIEWELYYRDQAIGAMAAAKYAVRRQFHDVDEPDVITAAIIEASGRLAAALILADQESHEDDA